MPSLTSFRTGQIYMKTGDMVMQAELVAHWADKKRLAFIGDGDAISVCVAYLKNEKIIDYGPSQITVFDFDERQVQAIKSFAERKHIRHLHAELYNTRDVFPKVDRFDRFYTNPPWGQSNDGASVHIFLERGIEACGYGGQGMIVIADDEELEWPKRVFTICRSGSSRRVRSVKRGLETRGLEVVPALQTETVRTSL
jgi:N4-bis(aminopropyl)spermidine synthase